MKENESYTIEEVANLLRVSKLTVYDLIKKREIPSYRVGRQIRVDIDDFNLYKEKRKGGQKNTPAMESSSIIDESISLSSSMVRPIIISGQDISLDILANHIEKKTKKFRPLRSYVGSLDSLISMYKGEADIVSTHLLDGDTGEYNLAYIRKILVNHRYVVVNLVKRWAGFYVKKGNPKNIKTWNDLIKPGVKMINREIGSGARVLIDEQLRIHQIALEQVDGYNKIETNHLSIAGAVSKGEVDVGFGIEKAAYMVDVDFIPIIKERYDLVILKKPQNMELINLILNILQTSSFQEELKTIKGHEISQIGEIIFEN